MEDITKIKYPQYRKYHNERSYFKIISPVEWEEIQAIGKNFVWYNFTARILPDRNFIYDLIFDYEKYGVEIGEKEYNTIKSKAENSY